MRVAAGVILIVAAVFNLIACLAYLGMGGAATYSGEIAQEIAQEAAQQSGESLTAEEQAQLDASLEEFDDAIGSSGVLLMAFGVFLLVSVGILIAGAVFLFQGKKAKFIMVAGGMAIAAEVIGILITSDMGVTNLVGLVGGILAIIAARSIGSGSAPEAPAAA